MAKYDDSKEKATQLAVVDKNSRGEKVVVSLIEREDDNAAFIDIRNYYTADDDTVRPTPKGVRYRRTDEATIGVIKGLINSLEPESLEQVREYLDDIEDKLEAENGDD